MCVNETELKSNCFDYDLAVETFGYQERDHSDCFFRGPFNSPFCSSEQSDFKQNLDYNCNETFIWTERKYWERFQEWVYVSDLEKKYLYCKLKNSNVFGDNSECSTVYEGCNFDSFLHYPPALDNFITRQGFESYIPEEYSENTYCDEDIMEIVNHKFNIPSFNRYYWTLNATCNYYDTFKIQVDIEKQCFNLSNSIFGANDDVDTKCQKMDDVLDCISNLVSECYDPKELIMPLPSLFTSLFDHELEIRFFVNILEFRQRMELVTYIAMFFLLDNINQIAQHDLPPQELLSTCSNLFERIEFDKWFTISNCSAVESLEEIVKQENQEIHLEQFLFFAELIMKSDTMWKLWLDEHDALCSFYYSSTYVKATSSKKCGLILRETSTTERCKIKHPDIFVAVLTGFETYLPTKSNADTFCKSDNDQRLNFIDISWKRKDNCTAYDAWTINGKINDECSLDSGLELCQAVDKMLDCQTSVMQACYDDNKIATIHLKTILNPSNTFKFNTPEILDCEFITKFSDILAWPKNSLIQMMAKVSQGEKCENEALEYMKEYEEAKKDGNWSEMENMACKYLDHYYYKDGGCWGHMDMCLENVNYPERLKSNFDFDCPKYFGLIKGFKTRVKLEDEVPNAFKKCFQYNLKNFSYNN